jgi:hypothetical protein
MPRQAELQSTRSPRLPSRRRGGRKKRFTAEKLIAALRVSHGMIAAAARALKCDRAVIYRYKQRYPQIDRVLEEERDFQLDVTELKLFEAIDRGEPWAITLYLKTQGRKRGYCERPEEASKAADHAVQPMKKPTLDMSCLTTKETEQFLGFIQRIKRINEPPAIEQGGGQADV